MNVPAAIVMVGSSVLLLVLLPALSFVLWPFGIVPTVAAALLTVSVENAPAPRWDVVHLRDSAVLPSAGWQHATYRDPGALHAVRTYLRGRA